MTNFLDQQACSYNLTSTLGTWRPIVFNVLRWMNNIQMTRIYWNDLRWIMNSLTNLQTNSLKKIHLNNSIWKFTTKFALQNSHSKFTFQNYFFKINYFWNSLIFEMYFLKFIYWNSLIKTHFSKFFFWNSLYDFHF